MRKKYDSASKWKSDCNAIFIQGISSLIKKRRVAYFIRVDVQEIDVVVKGGHLICN